MLYTMDIPHGILYINLIKEEVVFSQLQQQHLLDVIDYSFDNKYIIIKQKYNREVLLNELEMELSSWGEDYNMHKREGVINFNDVPVSLKEISKQIELRRSTNLADRQTV